MALSQIQCLDDNNVNPRTNESKPEFLYCEDQRLALETLLTDGREALVKFLEARGLRGFLSDLEEETLTGAVEPYDPSSDLFPESAEDDEPPLSLHYWPDLSEMSIPQMDLGWPDSDAYRGVTRTSVYTQPPLDGQVHIKQVVRKMIAQAQKVIAVVMDVFTDVDIFRDLIDAGFKRNISVYILLERTTLPHFLSMCRRANMHAGHLKHLRVRCAEGTEFYTRSCTKVRGRMGHRFMFIDGDKAVSGTYSFTWTSSRLDRNLITVVTGQAVDAFDRQFLCLYMSSSHVDLRQLAIEPEPEPEPIPQPAVVALPSADLARKLYSPKYSLVVFGNPGSSPTSSAGHSSPKESLNLTSSQTPEVTGNKKRRKKGASKEALQEVAFIHPGLVNLEKAYLILYLPTWPEPDPPSDVIGFINIRDSSKPTQVHLQRSERFETSQAIKFSTPFNLPKETLPDVATPRQQTARAEEVSKPHPTRDESVAGRVQSTPLRKAEEPEQQSAASGPRSEPVIDSEPNLAAHTPHNERPSHTTNSPKPEFPPETNTQKEEAQTKTSSNTPHGLETHKVALNTDLNSEQHTQEKTLPPPHTPACLQPQISSGVTPEVNTPAVHRHTSCSSQRTLRSQPAASTSFSVNNHIPIATAHTAMASTTCAPLPSITSSSSFPPLSSASPLRPRSPAPPLFSSPPVPKPRTVHLVIEGRGSASDGPVLPNIGVVRRSDSSAVEQAVCSESSVAAAAQKDDERTGNVKETQRRETGEDETEGEEAAGLRNDKTGSRTVSWSKQESQSDVLIALAPIADSLSISKTTAQDFKRTMTENCSITPKPQAERVAAVKTDTDATERRLPGCEVAKAPDEKWDSSNNRTTYLVREKEPQRISYCESNPPGGGELELLDTLKCPMNSRVSVTDDPRVSDDSTRASAEDTPGQRHGPKVRSADCADSMSNTLKDNTQGSSRGSSQPSKEGASAHTPKELPRLHLSDTRPDGLPSRTPDFQTPTSDMNDWYVSPRANSTLSTTSEEYYECSDSPDHEPAFVSYYGHFKTEDRVDTTGSHATTTGISSTTAATLDATERSTAGSYSLAARASPP